MERDLPDSGDLDVVVRGLTPASGRVRVLLFDRDRGFPGDPVQALRAVEVAVTAAVARVRLGGLASGRYAVAVSHDPWGVGFDATDWLGRPLGGRAGGEDFAQAAAHRTPGGAPLRVSIRYARAAPGTSSLDPPAVVTRAWRWVFGTGASLLG